LVRRVDTLQHHFADLYIFRILAVIRIPGRTW
jgi:hypothetical protein